MKQDSDWNPESYLQFKQERTLPSIDLVSRIDGINPRTIIDVGCGPGNSTRILAARWSKSDLMGIDNSPAMIEKAAKDFPDLRWQVMDAGNLTGSYDLVYSNATIQWIPDHTRLLGKLMSCVNTGGALAVQIPSYFEMPVKAAIDRSAADPRWRCTFPVLEEIMTINSPSFYYDELSQRAKKIDMWKTSYLHVMDSHQSIVEMIRTTGMKPFLDVLVSNEEKAIFESLVLKELESAYEFRRDGKVLFPFERLFFIAYVGGTQ